MIDLHSRRLAGRSIAEHMRTEPMLDALRAAAAARPVKGRVPARGTARDSRHARRTTTLAG